MNDLGHDWPRPMPEDWRTEAACRTTDPTVFFDERHGTRALSIVLATGSFAPGRYERDSEYGGWRPPGDVAGAGQR